MPNYITNDELYHALFGGKGKERKNHKYISREWKKNRWQYTYKNESSGNKSISNLPTSVSSDSLASQSIKDNAVNPKQATNNSNKYTSFVAKGETGINKASSGVLGIANKHIPKLSKKVNEIIKDNKFITNRDNYDEKIAEIENSKEWQDIVARRDPEYVTTNDKGETIFKIDEYLVKKKHPALDILDDLAEGRELDVNEMTLETFVAGTSDYIKTGAQMLGVISQALMTKFKFSQGSYIEQEETLSKTIEDGIKYTVALINTVDSIYDQAVELSSEIDPLYITDRLKQTSNDELYKKGTEMVDSYLQDKTGGRVTYDDVSEIISTVNLKGLDALTESELDILMEYLNQNKRSA